MEWKVITDKNEYQLVENVHYDSIVFALQVTNHQMGFRNLQEMCIYLDESNETIIKIIPFDEDQIEDKTPTKCKHWRLNITYAKSTPSLSECCIKPGDTAIAVLMTLGQYKECYFQDKCKLYEPEEIQDDIDDTSRLDKLEGIVTNLENRIDDLEGE